MNEPNNALGRKALDGLKTKLNSHGQEPIEVYTGDEADEAPDRSGRFSSRGLFQGVILEMESGNLEGIYYGVNGGRIRYDPSVGITFLFEDLEGVWKVTIAGNNLTVLHRDLTLGRRESVRIGEAVTGIEIEAFSPPGRR